jgi:hypothetical protein
MNAYSFEEWRRHLRAATSPSVSPWAWLLAVLPVRVVNALCAGWFLLMPGRSSPLKAYELTRPRQSGGLARKLASREGLR